MFDASRRFALFVVREALRFRTVRVVRFQNGEGAIATHVRFARITLFSRVTQFEFGFQSEDQKILIINPVPKMLYRTENGKTTELDNGDVVDGYKVYTASGFLGALERGSIDR